MNKIDEIGIVKTADVYDFDFITRSLGLIQIGETRAINPGAVVSLFLDKANDEFLMTIQGYGVLEVSHPQMIELEATIKRRAAEGKELQKQAIKDNLLAQQEAVNELNRGVAAPILLGGPGKRKL